MFWTMTALVLLKYVLIVLSANDHGEGKLKPASQPTQALRGWWRQGG